jgi:hypothetical protein
MKEKVKSQSNRYIFLVPKTLDQSNIKALYGLPVKTKVVYYLIEKLLASCWAQLEVDFCPCTL